MQSQSLKNQRVARNSLILYIRMLLLMIVSLYTSRVLLEALGVDDFGIYNVVGGLVAMLGFFTSSLTNVSQRYLNIGIGSNNREQTILYFKQCGTILFIFSLITLILGETIGLWFVINKLVIPTERMLAAIWVYQFSLLSVICSINQVNFLGAIVAHEKMNIYAYLGLFESIARLIVVFLILNSTHDHLILYAGLTSLISVIVLLFHIIYCLVKFDVCQIGLCWNKSLVKDMTKFISANLFGCFAWSAGVQGSNIVMNIFFGPVVNAAKAISMQVSTVISRFTENIMTAVKPLIIKSYASGEIPYMLNVVMKSSKYSFFISTIVSIPILIETEYILTLWLKNVPEYAIIFSRIVIIESLASIFITPLWIAANATGDIKRNQIYGRLFTLISLPLSYISLCIVPNPILPVAICASMQYLYWFYCIYDINKQLHLEIKTYVKQVVFPSIMIFFSLLFIGFLISRIGGPLTFLHFLMNVFITVILGLLLAFLLMTNGEKLMLKRIIFRKLENNNSC